MSAKEIINLGSFKVFEIAAPKGISTENLLLKPGQSIFVVAKGEIEFYLDDEFYGNWPAPTECIKDVVEASSFKDYAELRQKYSRFTVKGVTDSVCYCICSERHKNAHLIDGTVNKYKEGETVTFETDFILIGAGSAKSESNKYNEGSVVRKPKQITMLEDCVIASFNVTKKS